MNPDIENSLKKTPQYTRLKRHITTLLNHSTPLKIYNLFKVEVDRIRKKKVVAGYPYIIIFDTGNICNLQCPLCPTGLRETSVNRQLVKFQDFKKAIDIFAPYAYEVTLHNWGEPFLNPDILEMLHYSSVKNIGTNLSTNLNTFPFSAEKLIQTGLEYLIVSLDGTSQDVYSTYRVGGKLENVLGNLKSIIQEKKRMKSKTPFIEWQFLVMKHNCHQIDEAKRMAKELGVDLIRFIPVGLPFDINDKQKLAEKWYPYIPPDKEGYTIDRFLQKPAEGGCFYLYRSITINPVGVVAPCCAVWKESESFGSLLDTELSQIWNNEYYQGARELFSNGDKTAQTSCARCPLFKK